ncbi:nicotinate phosphoribosyltransferase [Pholiota molesta]|nr:nicotinate phosphoribosyltransferase [Pholiota molesta]
MSAPLADLAVPQSILDTDLYKLTMQQAVLRLFPDIHATYRFTNRNRDTLFSRQCIERFRTNVSLFSTIALTEKESEWLKQQCPYFTEAYLAYLASYRFKPEQVKVKYIPVTSDDLLGRLEIDITGPWVETILWEVPLMACLSETYFQTVAVDWNYDQQDEIAYAKGKTLLEANCHFSEFGTRRRRSFHAQDIVIGGLLRAHKEIPSSGGLVGTSNNSIQVHFAQKYNLRPIGTIAHEWFMGVGATKGYEHVNTTAMKLWEEVYNTPNAPLIALTDTFTTTAFIKDLIADPERAHRWGGLRQDSGDPFVFGPRMIEMCQTLGIPHDRIAHLLGFVNVVKCLEIKKQCDELGFTKALNIVIKLSSVNDKPCVKLSDDLKKTTGDKDTVEHIKSLYDLK